MTYTLTNNFHHTVAAVRPIPITEGLFAGNYKISRQTVLRLKRTLCGVHGCVCGGNFGERGGQGIRVINEDHDRNLIVEVD